MAWFKKTRKPIARRPRRKRAACRKACGSSVPAARRSSTTRTSRPTSTSARSARITSGIERGRAAAHAVRRRRGPSTTRTCVSTDPLNFTDTKPYSTRLEGRASRATGLKDAVIVASGAHRRHRDDRRRDGIRVHRRQHGRRGRREDHARASSAPSSAAAGRHRLLLGRRADDGRRAVADADGEDLRRARRGSIARGCRTSRCSPIRRPAA